MSYYLAPSLDALRAEINRRWPGRDKASDGWIGDTAHQATRSDHNPNDRGSVDAIDVDKDGVDMAAIIAAFQRHPSAHYWIYQGQIADRDDGWRRRTYTGANPHDKHAHFSIRQSRTAEQDRRPWGLLENEDDMTRDEFIAHLRAALTDPAVREVLRQAPWEFKPADHGGKTSAHAIVLNGHTHSLLTANNLGTTILARLDGLDEEILAGLGRVPTEQVAQALVAAGQDPGELAAELTKLAGTPQQ